MRTIRFIGRTAKPRAFPVGVWMDNGVEQVAFELPQIAEGQTETLYWMNGEHADADALEDGVWSIGNTMTQYPGEAVCYIAVSDGDELLWHSEPFVAEIKSLPDTEGTVEQAYPSALQQAIDTAAASAAEAAASAEAAEAAAASIGTISVENNRLIITGGDTDGD